MKRSPGRPTKINEDVIEAICNLIRAGHYAEVAAVCSGVSKATYYNWKNKGEEAKSGIFKRFHESLEEAEAQAELVLVDKVMKEVRGGPLEILRRRFPERWSPPTRIEQSGKLEQAIHHSGKVETKVEVVIEDGSGVWANMAIEDATEEDLPDSAP